MDHLKKSVVSGALRGKPIESDHGLVRHLHRVNPHQWALLREVAHQKLTGKGSPHYGGMVWYDKLPEGHHEVEGAKAIYHSETPHHFLSGFRQGGGWGSMFSKIGNVASSLGSKVASGARSLWNGVKLGAGKISTGLGKASSMLGKGVSFLGKHADTIKSGIATGAEIGSGLVGAATQLGIIDPTMGMMLHSGLAGTAETLQSHVTKAHDVASGAVQKVQGKVDMVKSKVDKVSGKMQQAEQMVQDMRKGGNLLAGGRLRVGGGLRVGGRFPRGRRPGKKYLPHRVRGGALTRRSGIRIL